MNKKQIIGLVVAAALFIVTGVSSVFANKAANARMADTVSDILTGGYEFSAPKTDYIAVVNVTGTIQEQTSGSVFEIPEGYQHTTTMEYLDYLMDDIHNTGVLLYVDSPGGAVYESAELLAKMKEYKEVTGRPIWTYMAHYAASGGYYVSMASDVIYANANTTTGSIGVIMAGYDLTGLYEKLGIEYVSITSGVNKDSSQLTDEQIAIYQSQVDESYEEFVSVVAEGRGMDAGAVKALADGRTYTAKQAKENGLVDEIASYEEMTAAMGDALGTDTFYELKSPVSAFTSLFAQMKEAVPKSEAQILTEIAQEKENGGLMYYAEQLQ